MSQPAQPPDQIRVKRKRVEEAPVTFLQFESGPKRHRSGGGAWVYRRKDSAESGPAVAADPSKPAEDAAITSSPSGCPRPSIQTSKPGDELRAPHCDVTGPDSGRQPAPPPAVRPSVVLTRASTTDDEGLPATSSGSSVLAKKERSGLSGNRLEPRRFHISRAALSRASPGAARAPGVSGISKRDRYGPVFVERRKKQKRVAEERAGRTPTAPNQPTSAGREPLPNGPDSDVRERTYKRPNSRMTPGASRASSAHRPAPRLNPTGQNMDTMAAAINAWALNEIGANVAEMSRPTARFRPIPPAKRYAERHPELARPNTDDGPGSDATASSEEYLEDAEEEEEEGEESDRDCIYDTYERVPADALRDLAHPTDVGILVVADKDEEDYFFGPDQDSEDEEQDDEDENAENHYTADYPEDELDSDDEYGRNAYNYRNGNASDEEEYFYTNSEDGADGDEEDGYTVEGDDDDAVLAEIRRCSGRVAEL